VANFYGLAKRIERLEQGSGKAQVDPEAMTAAAEVERDPEFVAVLKEHEPHLTAVQEKLEHSGEPPAISEEEERALALAWDALHSVALRIAKARGLDPRDVLRALSAGR